MPGTFGVKTLGLAAAAGLFAVFATSTAQACSSSTPCSVESGDYYVAMPERPDGSAGEPMPAVVYIHGFGGSPVVAANNEKIAQPFLDRGYAFIAPEGLTRAGRDIRSWSFHPDWPKRRDEVAFLTQVRDDAVQRLGLDPDKMLLAGFSIGGSMTSYTACADPDAFAAYAPLAGSFWRSHPEDCAGPVQLLHTHGWTDGTVPLEGRAVRGENINDPEALVQGDAFFSMQIWRATNGCVHSKADRFDMNGPFWRRIWERCTPGSALEFALYPGGHVVPEGWADMVVDWFEAL